MITVYKIKNTVNGRCYFGVTKQSSAFRWRQHVQLALRGGRKGALQGAIVKYGEQAFEVSDIYEATSVREAQAVERGLIAQYGTMWPTGYNMSTGGELRIGFRHNISTKEKMRASAIGREIGAHQRAIASANMKNRLLDPAELQKFKARFQTDSAKAASAAASSKRLLGQPSCMLGRTHTEESKAKMSAASKGRPAWNKGIPMSEAQKVLLVSVHTGRKASAETKEKMRLSAGKNKDVRSAEMKKLWADQEWREALLEKRAAIPSGKRIWTAADRQAASERMKKTMANSDRLCLARQQAKAQWADPEKRARGIAAAKEKGLRKVETRLYGAALANIRARVRSLPLEIYPREAA